MCMTHFLKHAGDTGCLTDLCNSSGVGVVNGRVSSVDDDESSMLLLELLYTVALKIFDRTSQT